MKPPVSPTPFCVSHLDPLVVDGLVGEDDVSLADGGGEGRLHLFGLLGNARQFLPVNLEVCFHRRGRSLHLSVFPIGSVKARSDSMYVIFDCIFA